MNARNFVEFTELIGSFNNQAEIDTVAVCPYPSLRTWLHATWEAAANPSTFVDRAIWYAGVRRIASSFALQNVLVDEANKPEELPEQIIPPTSAGKGYGCEISGSSSSMLNWLLKHTDVGTKDDPVLEIVHDGSRIISAAAQLSGSVSLVTAFRIDQAQGVHFTQMKAAHQTDIDIVDQARKLPLLTA